MTRKIEEREDKVEEAREKFKEFLALSVSPGALPSTPEREKAHRKGSRKTKGRPGQP